MSKHAGLAHFDASEQTFVARALEAIEAGTYDILFPPMEGRQYVPMGPMIDPGAQSVTYRQYRRTGKAALVGEDGGDLPNAGVSVEEFSRILIQIGAAYQFTNEELRAAALAARNGQPLNLDSERGQAAREAIERTIDIMLAYGTATVNSITYGTGGDKGLLGLLNLSGTATYTAATGAGGSQLWSAKTPDEVVADIAGLLNSQISATYKLHQANKVGMSIAMFQDISTRRMGDGSDVTILNFVKTMFPGVTFFSWQYCTDAGSGTTDRVVAFNSDPRYVRATLAREFTQEPPQLHNLVTKINCTAKLGGVVTPYPLSVTYMDSCG
jgi:hypothetical protein